MHRHRLYEGYGKRIVDIVCSCCTLVVLTPLFIVVASLIKMTSEGPVFYSQIRVGKNGVPFRLYKFRTMIIDADIMRPVLEKQNDMGKITFKIKNDPRVTWVGKYLRKRSIDELPQLWNVLKGDMSLVGPRPGLKEEVSCYSNNEKKRLQVLPGCSGLWQVKGRNELSFDEMIQLDMEYIQHLNFWNDINIIFKTIVVMITGYGAY